MLAYLQATGSLWLESFAANRTVVFRSNDLFALYCAARAGVGIALLPHFVIEAGDGLRPLVLEGVTFHRPLSLIMHRRAATETADLAVARQPFDRRSHGTYTLEAPWRIQIWMRCRARTWWPR